MIIPLWQVGRKPAARLARGRVPLEVKSFTVRGRHFVYEANDMRLLLVDRTGAREVLSRARLFTTRQPLFPPPNGACGMVTLAVTKACMLKCRYCFADPVHQARPLPLATARRALALIAPGRPLQLGFFGGEPLLAWERIREIVAAAEELAVGRGILARFSLTTNAVIMNADRARFLDAHNFSLIVSLDGPERLHDLNRPTDTGRGSYQLTRRGLDHVGEFPRLARRTTLRGTYDGSGKQAYLLERVRHLNEISRELGLANVSVEPADLSEGCFPGAKPVKPSAALGDEYLDTAAWYVDEIKAGRNPKFHHLAVRMKRLESRTPSPSECGAGAGYLSVDAGGGLYACHRLGVSRLGDLERGPDRERQAEWRDNRYRAREKCPACWLRNVCGGGCRQAALENRGDLRLPDRLGCWLAATCVKAAAWALAELRAGVAREGGACRTKILPKQI